MTTILAGAAACLAGIGVVQSLVAARLVARFATNPALTAPAQSQPSLADSPHPPGSHRSRC